MMIQNALFMNPDPVRKALYDSEAKYRALVEHSLQGVTIIQDDRFLYCSDTYAGMLGYTPGEMYRFSREDIINLAHPDDRDMMLARYQARLSGESEMDRYEYRAICKDGSIIWLDVRATRVEHDGRPAVQAVCLNVTERKIAEIQLRQSKERLDLILNSLGDGIFIKDRSHRLIYANDVICRVFGKPREELLGKTTQELLNNEFADAAYIQEERLFQTGEECLSEEEYTDHAGVPHVTLIRKMIIADQNGHKQLLCSTRDITEHKRLQTQFHQAQKMEAIGFLAGGIAHDFNNLLNIINGYTEIVLEDMDPGNASRKDMEKIRDAVRQGEELTDQLLVFNRQESIQRELLNINEVIESMRPVLYRLVGTDVTLSVSLLPDLWVIQSDPGQIRQIIMNLAVNARDAMPNGGCFGIETSNVEFGKAYFAKYSPGRSGSYILLTVSDSGIGMDAQTQAHLFEPFFTTKQKGQGTGLGLSSVYGIVKQNDGFIEVDSEQGIGTRFRIYLPKCKG